jgi:dUTP pyrophosphatase
VIIFLILIIFVLLAVIVLISFVLTTHHNMELMISDEIAELKQNFNELDAYVDNLKEYVLSDDSISVGVKQLHPDAKLPTYARPGDAGMDISTIETYTIDPGQTILMKTGIAMGIPKGYEIQVRSRSGLRLKTKLRVPVGTIDSGYVGEICIIADNIGSTPISFNKGDRVAQLVLAKVERAALGWVDSLEDTERGSGGMGSSGI